jgi:hypothetical protein
MIPGGTLVGKLAQQISNLLEYNEYDFLFLNHIGGIRSKITIYEIH